ncbi:MAG: hypothetical protein KY462_12560 [Actinobacteria bacterium]|nr:hypothetical protein [Actinomycetota bacterium]
MTDLVTTGPPLLELSWGHHTTERDEGSLERAFYPATKYHKAPGYLHGGVAAAALVAAGRLLGLDAQPPTSVAVSVRRPVPLGDHLQVVLRPGDEAAHQATIQRLLPPDLETDTVERLVEGVVRFGGYEPAPDLADARQLAAVPKPDAESHELFADCWVCGQDNPEGLQLVPGWFADGRVVSRLIADERYAEGGPAAPAVSPLLICAMLACPTLWACREQLGARPEPAATLVDLDVHFHADARPSTVLRTVGFEGASGRSLEFEADDPDRYLHGVSALVGEDGTIYATAAGTWVAVAEVAEREPGRPTPAREFMPTKAGRPEERSSEDWGEPLPGRREMPGPRSDRPGERA